MVRLVGSYPIGRWDLKLADGTKFGEWRAGGGHQSVVFGRHSEPDEADKPIFYRFAGEQLIELRFEEIAWPSWVQRPLPWEENSSPAGNIANGVPAGTNGLIDAELDKRIRAYVAKVPGAVSGEHGHDTTYRLACTLVQDWGLLRDQAWPCLLSWNPTCQPPWSEKELAHKLDDALKEPLTRAYGFLRFQEAPKMGKHNAEIDACAGKDIPNSAISAATPIDFAPYAAAFTPHWQALLRKERGYSQELIDCIWREQKVGVAYASTWKQEAIVFPIADPNNGGFPLALLVARERRLAVRAL